MDFQFLGSLFQVLDVIDQVFVIARVGRLFLAHGLNLVHKFVVAGENFISGLKDSIGEFLVFFLNDSGDNFTKTVNEYPELSQCNGSI